MKFIFALIMFFVGFISVQAETQRVPEPKEVRLFYDVGNSVETSVTSVTNHEKITGLVTYNKTDRIRLFSERLHRYSKSILIISQKSKNYPGANLHKDVGKK